MQPKVISQGENFNSTSADKQPNNQPKNSKN